MPTAKRNRLWIAWTLALMAPAAWAVLVLSATYAPEAMASGEPLRLLGIEPRPCPGCGACGLSRAFAAATRLRLSEAVGYNAGVLVHYPLALLLALAGPLVSYRAFVQGKNPPCPSPRSSS